MLCCRYGRISWLKSDLVEKDAKSLLQEYGLKHFAVLPVYMVTDRKGPDHMPEFTVTVTLDQHSVAASGRSRRMAEQGGKGMA